jgi:hypothetical protein
MAASIFNWMGWETGDVVAAGTIGPITQDNGTKIYPIQLVKFEGNRYDEYARYAANDPNYLPEICPCSRHDTENLWWNDGEGSQPNHSEFGVLKKGGWDNHNVFFQKSVRLCNRKIPTGGAGCGEGGVEGEEVGVRRKAARTAKAARKQNVSW